jgi:hypothetical protein
MAELIFRSFAAVQVVFIGTNGPSVSRSSG